MDTYKDNTWQRINHLQVLGESNLVIEWVKHNHHIRNSDLKPIMNKIVEVKSHFHDISFTCVYREFNTKVDNLSKDVLLLQEGTFTEQVFKGGIVLPTSKSSWILSCHLDAYETMNFFLGQYLEKLLCLNLEDHNMLEHKVCLQTLKGLVSFFKYYLFGHKMYIWFQTLKYQ